MNKIFILDIDGVLNYFPIDFLLWVESNYRYKNLTVDELRRKSNYREIKNNYRMCGVKKKQLMRDGVHALIEAIRKQGFLIWIVTSRPDIFENHSNTRIWLNTNKVDFDELIFCRGKYLSVQTKLSNDVECIAMLDDQEVFLKNIRDGLAIDFPGIRFIGMKFALGEHHGRSDFKVVRNLLDVVKNTGG